MTELPKVDDIVICQGAKFTKALHWYGAGKQYDEIEDVTPGYPTIITASGHGLPSSSKTPVWINGVKGSARVLNTGIRDCEAIQATYIDADTFSVPVPTVGKVYTAGSGYFEWYAPTDLTDYTARMHIREDVDDDTTLVELSSADGDITLSAPDGRITIVIGTSETEALDFDEGVYDLELVDNSGEATRILEGKVTLKTEVTR